MRASWVLAAAGAMVFTACKSEESGPEPGAGPVGTRATAKGGIEVRGVGFAAPASVLHVPSDGVYLVGNVNGKAGDLDDNGFISRVKPDGAIESLKWIDGLSSTITLHAPKGMAVVGNLLYVADVRWVRKFDLATGAARGAIEIPDATFLNGMTTDGKVVYVSDTGLNPDYSPSHTDSVYRIDGDTVTPVVQGNLLNRPSGLALVNNVLWVASFGGREILKVDQNSEAKVLGRLETEHGALAGMVVLPDGTALVSSWEGKAVYRSTDKDGFGKVVDSVASPTGLGWDAALGRVLIPLFSSNAVRFEPL